MPLELRPATSFSVDERVALFNAGYEDYFLPFRIDAAALRAMDEVYDVDVEASRVALHDGEAVGFANLAVRGAEAWVGGVGVVPAARRQGIAATMMSALHDEARSRGVRTVWLEVIEQNEGAFRLYEELGYRVTREVEVWTLPAGEAEDGDVSEVPAGRAHERVRELRTSREPWQRADETLAHYDDLLGLETGDGAAVFRVGTAVQLMQIAGADLHGLLSALRGRGTVSALNIPAGDHVAAALRDAGATMVVRQREMSLEL